VKLTITNCRYKLLLRGTVTVQNTSTSVQETLEAEVYLEAGQFSLEVQTVKTEASMV
jgi:hypothetical protein